MAHAMAMRHFLNKRNILDKDRRSLLVIGSRLCILNDLSSAATFIPHKTNNTNDRDRDVRKIKALLQRLTPE
ncbi:MAG: hypothetical protein AVO38_01385 [delta proteobacterium ML8_D]|nr:MAG: hypothetical protein AVO38_01385 [delta proteobacterium ML8_D]